MTLAREAIKLNSATYGDHTAATPSGLIESIKLPMNRTIIRHETPGALYWPQKDLGPEPPVVSGTLLMIETALDAFRVDVALGSSERKLWFWDGGVESYVYVKSGVITRVQKAGEGLTATWVLVTFEFISTRTAVYYETGGPPAAETIKWGGS